MALLKIHQDWDNYETDEYIFILNNDVVYSFNIENGNYLYNVYVQEKYRNQGFFNHLMRQVLKIVENKRLTVKIKKGSVIIEKYKNLGFNCFGTDNDYEYYQINNN